MSGLRTAYVFPGAPHHLVRMFRRVLGTTPRQFRETGAATPVL